MPELIPAILVKDADAFRERLSLMEGLVQTVQLDCMDGHFVDNRTWYEAAPVDSSLEIELHLMVSDPLSAINAWQRTKNVTRAIWHVEIPVDHEKIIARCRELGWECGLALSPETPVSRLSPLAGEIDAALILGVHPGWSGQTLIPSCIDKVSATKKDFPGLRVEFDGGVTAETIPALLEAGTDRLCVASAIFSMPDPRSAARAILELI